MRLGSETDSPINAVMATSKQVEPAPFLGATILNWTDRQAGTIVEVGTNYFVVQHDTAKLAPGIQMPTDQQSYFYVRNPNGPRTTFRRVRSGARKGEWREDGLSKGNGVLIGHRQHYRDPSF